MRRFETGERIKRIERIPTIAEATIYALVIIFLPLLLMAFLKMDIVKTSLIVLLFSIFAVIKLGFLNDPPEFTAGGLWTGVQIASIVVAALLFYNVYEALGYEEELKISFGREYSGKAKLPLAVFYRIYREYLGFRYNRCRNVTYAK